jgi:hypothetical protein
MRELHPIVIISDASSEALFDAFFYQFFVVKWVHWMHHHRVALHKAVRSDISPSVLDATYFIYDTRNLPVGKAVR